MINACTNKGLHNGRKHWGRQGYDRCLMRFSFQDAPSVSTKKQIKPCYLSLSYYFCFRFICFRFIWLYFRLTRFL